jgi:hypothetical protein
MQRYGHLRREHSLAMMQRVSFAPKQPENVIPLPDSEDTEAGEKSSLSDDRRALAKAKAKYSYPWWASENPLEVFWGQLNEEIMIVPLEKFLDAAKRAMGREVFKQELADRQALMDELMERVPEATLKAIRAKMPARKQADHHQAAS